MNYSFRFSSETNKNRLGRARKSFGLARPPIVVFIVYIVSSLALLHVEKLAIESAQRESRIREIRQYQSLEFFTC